MSNAAYDDLMQAMERYHSNRTGENAVILAHAMERFEPPLRYAFRDDWETFRTSEICLMIDQFPAAFPNVELPKFDC